MPMPPIQPVFYIEFFILLAIDPHEPGTIYAKGPAQTASDQLYKTTDGGLSWSEIGRPPYASVLTIDPQNSSTIYAAGAGVSRSTDAGMSWNEVNSGLRASPVLSLAIDPESSGTLLYAWSNAGFVGVHGGIYRSTDGGASWKAADSGLPEYCPNCDGDIDAVSTIVVDLQNPATLRGDTG